MLSTHYILKDSSASVGSSNPLENPNPPHSNDKLPIELLVYISSLASTVSLSIFDGENLALWNGRLTLAAIIAVCRLWRIAALGAQSLWSTIVLPSGSKHIKKCLEASLYYSKNSAIDVFFFRVPGRPVYDNLFHKAREHAMISEILSQNGVSSRLRVLSNIPIGYLALNGYSTRHSVANFFRDAGQTIQAVGLLHWEHTNRSELPLTVPTTIEILESLPANVRKLSLQSCSWHANQMTELFESPSPTSLWGRLSHLRVVGPHCIYFMDANTILRECSALEEAQFFWILGVFFAGDHGYGPMFGRERLILPRLRQLVIQKFDGDATWLLDAISSPAIVNLAIKQQNTVSRKDLDQDAAMRWESFIQRTFTTSVSPDDVLHEVWVHGLPKESIEYILSSRAATGVRSIALAMNNCVLPFPGYMGCSAPLVQSLDSDSIYNEAAAEYGLPVENILQEYETVPWYGWNHTKAPLRLSGFAAQCLDKIIVWVDVPTHLDLD